MELEVSWGRGIGGGRCEVIYYSLSRGGRELLVLRKETILTLCPRVLVSGPCGSWSISNSIGRGVYSCRSAGRVREIDEANTPE